MELDYVPSQSQEVKGIEPVRSIIKEDTCKEKTTLLV
jgi:hypothetical protein